MANLRGFDLQSGFGPVCDKNKFDEIAQIEYRKPQTNKMHSNKHTHKAIHSSMYGIRYDCLFFFSSRRA